MSAPSKADVSITEEPDAGNLQVRLYVQRGLKCSAGD